MIITEDGVTCGLCENGIKIVVENIVMSSFDRVQCGIMTLHKGGTVNSMYSNVAVTLIEESNISCTL